MPASEAQIRANRENAKKSSGPKTPEGKARSRCNALKHGLTGEGVALPSEDSAEIESRYREFEAEFRPSGAFTQRLVKRIAFLSTRLDRCERFDSAHYSGLVREARSKHDDSRKALVEALVDDVSVSSATSTRRLQAIPEGIDWLLDEWQALRDDLDHPDRPTWGQGHLARSRGLRGISPSRVRATRETILTEVMGGFFLNLEPGEADGLDDAGKREWARVELLKIVDAEMARLADLRAGLDYEALAKAREESVDRALFDASKEMILARKYEAATERAMYKALREFREAEASGSLADADGVSDCPEETCEESGSFGNDPEPAEPDTVEEVEEAAESVPETPEPPKWVEKTPEERKKRPDPARLRRR